MIKRLESGVQTTAGRPLKKDRYLGQREVVVVDFSERRVLGRVPSTDIVPQTLLETARIGMSTAASQQSGITDSLTNSQRISVKRRSLLTRLRDLTEHSGRLGKLYIEEKVAKLKRNAAILATQIDENLFHLPNYPASTPEQNNEYIAALETTVHYLKFGKSQTGQSPQTAQSAKEAEPIAA